MTVKELYEWALSEGAENFDIEIDLNKGRGYFTGYDSPELVNKNWTRDSKN